MAKKKKCNWCEETTNKSREEFCEIDWHAVQFGKDKMVCACPKHHKELMGYVVVESGLKKASKGLQAFKKSLRQNTSVEVQGG